MAHNRRTTALDTAVVSASYAKLANAVGAERFVSLASRCTEASDLSVQLRALHAEVHSTHTACKQAGTIDAVPVWMSTRGSWWFDDTYLERNLGAIRDWFAMITQYSELPRGRGTGHQIEAWVKAQNPGSMCASADACFNELLETFQGPSS